MVTTISPPHRFLPPVIATTFGVRRRRWRTRYMWLVVGGCVRRSSKDTKLLEVESRVSFFIKDLLRKRMVNDTISDVLTRIRNACLIKSQTVSIPMTRLTQQICHTLEKEGFIESFQRDSDRQLTVQLRYKGAEKKPCITNLRRISKPGLRVYTSKKQIPTILGGMGILVLSTSQGIMTDREAKFRGIGGEILCSIW